MKKRLVTVASDFGPSQLARGLVEKLGDGFGCRTFLGEGKIPSPFQEDDVRTAVEESDLVIIDTSEYCGMEVCAGQHAVSCGKPLALISLFPDQLQKKEYAPFRSHIRFIFVLNEGEAETARALYPKATIIVTGNPDWESFSFPKRTRDGVREILKVSPQEKLVLVSGEKEVGINFPLAVNVIEAIADLPNPQSFKVIFGIHPGHAPLPGGADLLEFYKELGRYHPKVSVVPACKAVPFGIGTPDIVPGADLVIGTNSTVQIQAAYLGIPAIAVLLRRAFRGIELPREHQGWWTPCEQGAIAPVYGLSSERTAQLMTALLTEEGFAPMREMQRRYFPPAARIGQAFEKMREAIRNF